MCDRTAGFIAEPISGAQVGYRQAFRKRSLLFFADGPQVVNDTQEKIGKPKRLYRSASHPAQHGPEGSIDAASLGIEHPGLAADPPHDALPERNGRRAIEIVREISRPIVGAKTRQ